MPILTQAPDPNPKTPKLALPPGSCDTHIHLFGPADKYPFAPDSPYTSRDALAETYIALQDKLGLARAVIVSGGGYGRNYRLMADTLARLLADKLSRAWPQSVIVENISGGAMNVGAEHVARAAPDGHTILLAPVTTLAMGPSVHKSLPYDTVKDFAPVGLVGSSQFALIVNPRLGVTTLGELVAFIRSKP